MTLTQILPEAGFAKGADGFYTSPTQGRFTPEIRVLSGAQNEAIRSIMAAGWRQAGFYLDQRVLSATEAIDPQVRGAFPSMSLTATSVSEVQQMARYRGSEVMTEERGWRGGSGG